MVMVCGALPCRLRLTYHMRENQKVPVLQKTEVIETALVQAGPEICRRYSRASLPPSYVTVNGSLPATGNARP